MTCEGDLVDALHVQLHQLPCPTCGSHELAPMLQCDYYPDGCLWLVHCDACQTKYHIDRRSVPTWGEGPKAAIQV